MVINDRFKEIFAGLVKQYPMLDLQRGAHMLKVLRSKNSESKRDGLRRYFSHNLEETLDRFDVQDDERTGYKALLRKICGSGTNTNGSKKHRK